MDSALYVFSVRVGSELIPVPCPECLCDARVQCSSVLQGAGLAVVGPSDSTSSLLGHNLTPPALKQPVVKVESVSHRARGHGSERTGPAPAAEDVLLP